MNTDNDTSSLQYEPNWVFPNEQTMISDFSEYKKKENRKWKQRADAIGMVFPMFTNYDDFKTKLKNAEVVDVTPMFDRLISNRSHTRSIEELKSLVSQYYRPRDVDRIVDGLTTGAAMPMPIIVKGNDGMWIMAGNTRLDAADILGMSRKALLVDLSK